MKWTLKKFKEDMIKEASDQIPFSSNVEPHARNLENAFRDEKLSQIGLICDLIEEYDKRKQE